MEIQDKLKRIAEYCEKVGWKLSNGEEIVACQAIDDDIVIAATPTKIFIVTEKNVNIIDTPNIKEIKQDVEKKTLEFVLPDTKIVISAKKGEKKWGSVLDMILKR